MWIGLQLLMGNVFTALVIYALNELTPMDMCINML